MPNDISNMNFLSQVSFEFNLKKLPKVNFFVVRATIPSVSLGSVQVGNPFVKMNVAGDKVDFSEFQLSFKVDEDLANYLEIYDWIMGLGFPQNYDQYARLRQKDKIAEGRYSDGTLTILTSSKNANKTFHFANMFPVSLSELEMNAGSTDVEYLECTASFKYDYFTMSEI